MIGVEPAMDTKDELMKQHAKVAEDACAGWEKAENEVVELKRKLEDAANKNIVLEDRVSHLDGALNECVRKLRQSRDDQEEIIQEVVTERTKELISAKAGLERRVLELQKQAEAAKAGLERRVLELQKQAEAAKAENLMLRGEFLEKCEEFEILMIERDLSTQAAETASKQHLDSIKKVAKLEAECRKLRILAKSSSSLSSNRSSDSHSDGGRERIEGSWSDSWALSSALISDLDQFKIKKGDDRSLQGTTSSTEVDLMDDFLEMERLVALPERQAKNSKSEYELSLLEKLEKLQTEKNELENEVKCCREAEKRLSLELEAVVCDKMELEDMLKKMEAELKLSIDVIKDKYQESRVCFQEVEMLQAEKNELDSEVKCCREAEKRLSLEFEAVVGDKMELEDKLEKMEAEKAELKISFDVIKDQYQESRVCFQEVEMKLEEIKGELKLATESKTQAESRFIRMEAEVGKEKSVSDEIRKKCQALEEELRREIEEKTIIKREKVEPKIKQEDIATAAGKFLDCQKTIASLGKKLQSLATLEDFLIDTSNIPDSARPVYKKEAFLGKDPLESIKTVNGRSLELLTIKNSNIITSPSCLSSSDWTTVSLVMSSNRGSSEKNRNGFATVFTRSRNGITSGDLRYTGSCSR